jgi:hypothetical protein
MANQIAVDSALQVKAWDAKGTEKLVKSSLFYQLGNYFDYTTTQLANPKEFAKIPPSVMLSVTDKLGMGKTSISIPWFDELKTGFRAGSQVEAGNEEAISMLPFTATYNVWRKSTPVSDITNDYDATEYFQLAAKAKDRLFGYAGKMIDFNCQRALIEGGDITLTDSTYWTGPTFSTNPVTASIHPFTMVDGATSFVTWNNTYATYEASIESAAGAMSVSNTMTVAKVLKIAAIASIKTKRLGWSFGGQSVDWILKVSNIQAQQIKQDATAISGFIARTQLGEDRGDKNRSISGIVGIWDRVMVVEDHYAPIYTHAAATTTRFGYFRPDFNINANPTRVAHGAAAATGTCEIAVLMGDKAIVDASPMMPQIVKKESTDYEFSKEMAIQMKQGKTRPDFRATGSTSQPTNETSFVYLTATPSDMFLGN